ncbi:hypothetical protein [Aminobacter sp. MSH1]|uniref:hypothetical protein n=1 Tax=Aminobacter sp. MSH1 TaxID=374606 RepID=UPI000D3A6D11|nr:hypothetical protein [Aminobacter sp. MSH1]
MTIPATTTEKADPLAIKPDPNKAASACRQLIRAQAGRGNTEKALNTALAAFGLPDDYLDTEGGRWK